MNMKIRPVYIILFLAVGLAAIFHYIPGLLNALLIAYFERMPPQKSYLSQVLNGDKAEINTDQLYLLTLHFGLSQEDTDYLTLLLEYSRSSLKERKNTLKQKIQALQKRKLSSENYLKVSDLHNENSSLNEYYNEYYLDAYNQLVHVCLSQREYQKNPKALAEVLGLKPERLQEILLELQRLNLITVDASGVKAQQENFHLAKTSKLFKAWKTQMRQMALQRSLQSRAEDTYNFSVIFSCTEAVKKDLQAKFFKFIQEAQQKVNESESEHVYQMNFDLLSWT